MFTTQPRVSVGTVEGARAHSRPTVRRFYLGLTLFMIAIAFAGFWPSYFGRYIGGLTVDLPWAVHLHAATFMGWLALLLMQVLLVAKGRTRLHLKLGTFGIGYGGFVLVMGLFVSFAAPLHHLAVGGRSMDKAANLLLSGLFDMALFAGFFAAAVAYRRRPELHKRLILLATVALILPGVARLVLTAVGFNPLMVLPIWLSPLLAAMGYDLFTRRRVHPAYLIGAALLIARIPLYFIVISSDVGQSVGQTMLRALM